MTVKINPLCRGVLFLLTNKMCSTTLGHPCGSQRRSKCSSRRCRLRHAIGGDRKRLLPHPIRSVSSPRRRMASLLMRFLRAVLMMAETCLLAEHAICHPPFTTNSEISNPAHTNCRDCVHRRRCCGVRAKRECYSCTLYER